jgi:transposase
MSNIKKSIHSKGTKFRAALAMLKGDRTTAELIQEYGVHPSMLHRWKQELLNRGAEIFEMKTVAQDSQAAMEKLQRKIGELTMEIDFLKKVSGRLM